jgi:hypothetical protein
MTEQTEALRLAECLERDCEMNWPDYDNQMAAAAELRRLHAVNAQLLEALNGLLMCTPAYPAAPEGTAQARAHKSAIKAAFAAIAAARGQA